MRAHTSILICLLMAYYPCNAFFSNVWNIRRFSEINSLPFKNYDTDVKQFDVFRGKFEQRLDHFDPTNNITWEQLYVSNTKFFKPGTSSPVFLWVSSEDSVEYSWTQTGTWLKYAEKYGALLLQLEQRFYGESQPTKDKSTENLKYLNIEQALADAAYFIEGINKKFGFTDKNKWIAFGESEGASLAAWLRYKYPHLVHGAVSSSSPLLAKANFYEFFDVVRSSLNTYGEECSNVVTDALLELHQLLKDDAGKEKINKLFKLCTKLDGTANEKDEQNLFFNVAFASAAIVQYSDYFYSSKDRNGIDVACDVFLTNKTWGDPLDRYAEFTTALMLAFQIPCISFKYSDMITNLRNIKWEKPSDSNSDRSSMYQSCTEWGFFQTSEKDTSLYGPFIDSKYYVDICTDVFGPSFALQQTESGVNRTNTFYGGLNIKATRVAYVHGSLDPWYPVGITHSNNPQAPDIFINGSSHAADANPEFPNDSPQLKEARAKISALIGDWLKEQ